MTPIRIGNGTEHCFIGYRGSAAPFNHLLFFSRYSCFDAELSIPIRSASPFARPLRLSYQLIDILRTNYRSLLPVLSFLPPFGISGFSFYYKERACFTIDKCISVHLEKNPL